MKSNKILLPMFQIERRLKSIDTDEMKCKGNVLFQENISQLEYTFLPDLPPFLSGEKPFNQCRICTADVNDIRV